MISGGTPAVAQETIRPSGDPSRTAAVSSRATTKAAPPSTMPLAFPAVTSPSFRNAGRSRASPSRVVCGRRCPSSDTTFSPFRVFTLTGTISSACDPAR